MSETETPIRGFKLALLTFALALGTFIQILDTSIATVAIPTIAGNLAVSTSDGTWIITSFSASNAIVLPLTGWLSSQLGRTRLFIISTIGFSLTSWLCGIAWNLPSLVLFRTLQGAVAGTLIPLSQTLLLMNYPKNRQSFALAIWTMVVVTAPVLGPVLGGWITYDYGWEWIFYINIPLGFLSAYLTWFILKGRDSERKKLPIDYFALVLLILSVSSLQIALDKGNQWDWFRSTKVNILFVTFIISTTCFLVWNRLSKAPVIDFKLFKNLNFVLGTVLVTIGFVLYFGGTVLMPLWVQNSLGYTPLLAGLAVMSIGIGPVITSIPVSRWMEKYDLRTLVTISFLIFAATFYWYTDLNTEVDFWGIAIPRFWQGFAISIFFLPLVKLSLFDLPKEELASGSGVFNFIRILFGGGIGTSLSITFYNRRAVLFHSNIAESIDAMRPEFISWTRHLKSLGFSKMEAIELLNDSVNQQSETIALINYFWLSALLFILSSPLIWLCKKVKAA